jgi:ABC-type lipoprotein export system ATPase subunit
MKVSRIEIKDFQQFKDFELDLTYPQGHPKAGQPLDKVCFIGQSGTGKTTILNLIEQLNSFANDEHIITNSVDKKAFCIMDITYQPQNAKKIAFALPHNSDQYACLFNLQNQKISIDDFYDALKGYDRDIRLLYLKQDTSFSVENKYYVKDSFLLEKSPKKIWQSFEKATKQYSNEKSKFRFAISKAVESGEMEKAKILSDELLSWTERVINPLTHIADNVLNPILKKFGLNVKTDVDNLSELEFINLCNSKGKTIPLNSWSTGTLQIVLKMLALYHYKPEQAMILVDEPENSLFPDTQRDLIKQYIQAAPTCQFFFATHSPIIASQFEPCERFILTFDEETGFVKAHNGIAPEGDDPNDLLTKDFGMRNLMGEKGLAAWERFIELKMLIREEKEYTQKETFMKEYLTLQREYNF